MAKVKITGHASGSGVLTITAPNTSTNRTVTLPDSTGTLLDTTSGLDATKLSGNLPALSGASLTNIPPQGRKNIIINGDFRTNQYGLTASTVAVTNGAFNIDRAKNYLVGVSGTVALGDAEAVNGTYETPLKYTAGSTASGRIGLYQTVEDYHLGETLTASAWVKSDNANARIVAYDGSTTTSSNTHTGGGGWELLKVTFSQRTNASQLYIWTAIISATVGSVSVASGDYIFITKFQCERGSVATEFERLTNAEQLSLCQRYYYLHATKEGGAHPIGSAAFQSTNFADFNLHFPTTMRTKPTLQYVSGTDYYTVYANDQLDHFSDFATRNTSPNAAQIYTNGGMGTGIAAGHAGVCYTRNVNAFMAFTAEL